MLEEKLDGSMSLEQRLEVRLSFLKREVQDLKGSILKAIKEYKAGNIDEAIDVLEKGVFPFYGTKEVWAFEADPKDLAEVHEKYSKKG